MSGGSHIFSGAATRACWTVVQATEDHPCVPVWPVPRPRPRRVRGGPVAAREGRLHHPSQKVDRSAGSDRECGGLSSSQEDLYIFMCSLL